MSLGHSTVTCGDRPVVVCLLVGRKRDGRTEKMLKALCLC